MFHKSLKQSPNVAIAHYGELASSISSYSNVPIYTESFSRDLNGRILSKTVTQPSGTEVYFYVYDNAGRLESVTLNNTVIATYAYDSNSNRTSRTSASGTVSATYDDQDRLLTYGSKTFTYNLNGELESFTDLSKTTSFEYDVLGNLKEVSKPTQVVSYKVDAHNRRITKSINGIIQTYYIWDIDNKLIGTADSSGALTSQYIYGTSNHSPDYIVKGTAKYRIFKDHLGSPVKVVNSSTGAIAQEIQYDEFGIIISDSAPGFTVFGFAGCMYDSDTGFCRFGARDYDASIGRWLSKDPILFAGGDSNLYGYVMQDPINLIDPSGLAPGDNFGSESAAGYDAINYINSASIYHNREFSGSIYRNVLGGYSYTVPKWGSAAGANPGDSP